MARPSSGADSEGPQRGRAAASSDAVAAAAGTAERRVSYIVAPAAALPGRWGLLDVLRLVLRYAREHVLRLIRRNSGTEDDDAGEEPRDAGEMVADEEPRDGGVVVGKNVAGSPGGKKKNKNKSNLTEAPKKKKKNKKQNNTLGATKKIHAHLYRDWRPRPIPSLMVGNCRVYKKQIDLYTVYCQERPSSGPSQLCHMCILEENYSKVENTILPNAMLLHCCKKHLTAGIECTESGCGVRVHTEEERLLHIHFCHRLPPGWWEWNEYKL